MLTVTKEYQWAMAHMLEGHQGLCLNLHGHEYKMLVEVRSTIEEGVQPEGPAAGMVLDFKALKQAVNSTIVDKMDHGLMLNVDSSDRFEQALFTLAVEHNKRIIPVHYRPTAENMAKDFYYRIKRQLENSGLSVAMVSVTLYETPTSFAKYQEDN